MTRTTCNSAEYERLRARCARLAEVVRARHACDIVDRRVTEGLYRGQVPPEDSDLFARVKAALDAALDALEPEDTVDD